MFIFLFYFWFHQINNTRRNIYLFTSTECKEGLALVESDQVEVTLGVGSFGGKDLLELLQLLPVIRQFDQELQLVGVWAVLELVRDQLHQRVLRVHHCLTGLEFTAADLQQRRHALV